MNEELPLERLLQKTSQVIVEVLHVKDTVALEVTRILNGFEERVGGRDKIQLGNVYNIRTVGHDSCVTITAFEIPADLSVSSEISGKWLSIDVDISRSCISFIAVACVAIAAASLQNCIIHDDAMIWSNVQVTTAEALASRLSGAVDMKDQTLEVAAATACRYLKIEL